MRFQVVHHGRKWARADNHMDCRHCPQCGATVNGNRAQHKHQQWHLDLQEVLDQISARAGIVPDEGPPAEWTAEVVGGSSDLEPAEG